MSARLQTVTIGSEFLRMRLPRIPNSAARGGLPYRAEMLHYADERYQSNKVRPPRHFRGCKLYRKEFRELIRLALPLVFAQLAQNSTSFVDTLMVGRLGNKACAAGIAIGNTVFFFVLIVLSGVLLGVGPIVSQATGADDPATARGPRGKAYGWGFYSSCRLSCFIGTPIHC